MPDVWVTVDFVNQPRAGKKLGNIKTKELGYIWMKPEILGQFQPRKRFFISYDVNGDFNNFAGFPNPPQTAPAPQQAQRPQATQRAPVQVRAGYVDPQPMDITAMNIFVTGIVGRALGSGHFTAQDISELTKEARAAFMTHLNGTPQRQSSAPEPEFNDPLPDPNSYGAVNSEDIPF